MYCCCGPLITSSSLPVSATGAGALLHPDRERGVALSREQAWMDAHAHPGRFFLMDLPADEPVVQLLGSPDPENALRDLHRGGVRLCAFATVADLRVLTVTPRGIGAGREFEPDEAAADHRRQLGALRRVLELPGCHLVRGVSQLGSAEPDEVGVILSCEGADFLEGKLEGLEEVYAEGARSITLVHYRINELGDIQTEAPVHGGLSAFGAEVVREMNRLGMVIDLAHATWEVTRDVLDRSHAPVLISHSHLARGSDSHPRLLSREHALAVARSGGVVAAWPSGVALSTFDDFVDEILRMLDLLDVEHVALGTDMHANYQPVLTSHGQVPDLAAALLERGAGEDTVGRVLGGNLVRLYSEVLAG